MRLTPAERAYFRKRFVVLLCNFQSMEMYYCPVARRLILRSPAATKKQRLPASAVRIGCYTHPFGADDFLTDLDDVLAKIEREETRRGADPTNLAFA